MLEKNVCEAKHTEASILARIHMGCIGTHVQHSPSKHLHEHSFAGQTSPCSPSRKILNTQQVKQQCLCLQRHWERGFTQTRNTATVNWYSAFHFQSLFVMSSDHHMALSGLLYSGRYSSLKVRSSCSMATFITIIYFITCDLIDLNIRDN